MKLLNVRSDPGVAEATKMKHVGVLGASSFVGKTILPLLTARGLQPSAFTRQRIQADAINSNWVQLDPTSNTYPEINSEISTWICAAPIGVLADYLPWLKSLGARRVVALSSTSRYTKNNSSDVSEQAIAEQLIEGEQKLIAWAEANNIEWIILRPTLIYGLCLDKNICEIARFIRRYSFFPVFGKAEGLRQPIHVQDLAQACVAAISTNTPNRAYNLSGGETLTYREMVARVFSALGQPARMLAVPLPVFRLAVAMLRLLPRYRKWTAAMAERMNQDLVFDHTEAEQDLGFKPRPFVLSAQDLP